jgi:peroxiredoxin
MAAEIPYLWVNDLLLECSAVLVVTSVVLLSGSFVFRRFPKRRLRWAALASFLLGVIFGGSNYGFLFYVQLPAYARAVQAGDQTRAQARADASSLVKRGEPRADASSLVKRGERAPAFRLKTLDGSEIELERLRGKTVVLVFFATWCGPCNQELPHIQEMWDANRNRADFALVVVGREETAEKLTAFKAERGYTFPIASDPDRALYSRYAKELIPRTYLIAPDGTIRFASTGFSEERLAELREELAKQLRPQKA